MPLSHFLFQLSPSGFPNGDCEVNIFRDCPVGMKIPLSRLIAGIPMKNFSPQPFSIGIGITTVIDTTVITVITIARFSSCNISTHHPNLQRPWLGPDSLTLPRSSATVTFSFFGPFPHPLYGTKS